MKIGITDYAEKYIKEHTTRKKYYSEESYNKIKQQLEAYENMRKEAKKYIEEHIVYETDDCINGMQFCSYHLYDFSKEDLLNILNKIGGSDE